jgi:hypothetical protein
MTQQLERNEASVVRVHADHSVIKHLGNWTSARSFEIRARRGTAVIDLRSPHITEGDIELNVELDHALVRLLLPADAVIDQWGLQWTGRGAIKDAGRPAGAGAVTGGRMIRLSGRAGDSQIRVSRGGLAVVAAICSRAYLEDARKARREGGVTTVDNPARG